MKKVRTSFAKLNWMAMVARAQEVEKKMNLNPNFPTPIVPVPTITTGRVALENAGAAAADGGKALTLARNKRADELAALLTQEAIWVNAECKGDEEKLTSSGFELQSTPKPVGVPVPPPNFNITRSDASGAFDLSWKNVIGADAYQVRMSETDPNLGANWQVVVSTTKHKCSVENLKPGKNYWFCVTALGAAGESAFSNILARMAA